MVMNKSIYQNIYDEDYPFYKLGIKEASYKEISDQFGYVEIYKSGNR